MIKPEAILTLRKWDSVLFTTYALSISFFESYVLHHLRRKGFDEIWVVADAEGYQNSMMERRAWGAGRDYHLIPVRVPGVFHCKCAYFSSTEGDVLLIGSGNLTFGGFGRNLEALQVLTPDGARGVFLEFAGFLESLGYRSDFLNPESKWIQEFSSRARRASSVANASVSGTHICLVHSVEQPIVEQICSALKGHAPVHKILVLSPYHDPSGHAVRALAEGTGCAQVAISLPANPKTPSAFPFPLAKSWKRHVSAVRPDTPPPHRPLHAKWFEFAFAGGVATLVGSVNATSQALCSTNNIELGVLRFDANEETLGVWKKAEVPTTFQPNEFPLAGQGQTLSVFAVLHSNGQLTGRVLTNLDCSGIWKGQLEYSSGETVRLEVSVGSEGTFCELFQGNFEETLSSTVQLILRRNDREARGWVHVEEVLCLPERDRRVLGAIGRFVRGNADEDDDIALLEYLAASAVRHLNAFDLPLRLEPAPDSKASSIDEETAIDLDELKPDPNAGPSAETTGSAEGAPTYVLDKWFGQLRKRLLGRQGVAEVAVSSVHHLRQATLRASEEDDEDERQRKVERVESALENFDRRMRHLVETPDGDARVLRTIFVVWLEVKLNMLAFRLADPAGASLFAREWFEKVTTRCELGSQLSALEQHVFALAGAMPSVLDKKGCVEWAYMALHEALERFCRGAVPVERALQGAGDSSAWVARALLKGSEADVASSLKRILDSRTLRQEVETVLSCLNSHQPIPENSILFDTPEGHALRPMLATGLADRYVSVVEHANDGCPGCQYKPTAQVEQSLRNSRIASCSHCNRILLRIGL